MAISEYDRGFLKWFHRQTKQPEVGRIEAPDIVRSVPLERLSCEAAQLQGQGKRKRQEDACCLVNITDPARFQEEGLLAVVADGMGGMQDGQLASQTAVVSLQDSFAAMDRSLPLSVQLREGLTRANREVFEAVGGEGGTTAVVCIIYAGKLWFSCVGDSYLYLWRNRQLLRLNREQNVLHELWLRQIREGNLHPSRALWAFQPAAITQFLGMDELDDIDELKRPLPLRDGDILLLCSDGVVNAVTPEGIAVCLDSGIPGKICEALEQAIFILDDPRQDNYTALVIRYTQSGKNGET